MKLWQGGEHPTTINYYKPENKCTDVCVLIFPGGGYSFRAEHEGKGYAEFLAKNGVSSFVVDYRVTPDYFPLPLLDARRAVRFVREHASEYGVNPHKIFVMGSSAGGHLAAMLSTYTAKIEGEGVDATDDIDFLPDGQILCYPVILCPEAGNAHEGSYKKLLGEENLAFAPDIDPSRNVTENTPPAFIWHTAADAGVNVINSYEYAKALRNCSVPVEMHIFPEGKHGLGLAGAMPHVAQWTGLLINWIKLF